MKKVLKVLLVFFLIAVLAVGVLVVINRKYVAVLWKTITSSSEKIAEERTENNKKFMEEINSYLEGEIRDFTEEEKTRIEHGEDEAVIYSEILGELNDKKYIYDVEKQEMLEVEKKSDNVKNNESSDKAEADKKTEKGKTDTEKKDNNKKKTADEIIATYMSQLYALQSAYTGRVESLVSQGAAYYNAQVKLSDRATARAQTISHFTSIVRGEEAACDAQFEKIVSQMKKELEGIGADTSIVGTARKRYNKEKELKMSYYAGKYLK